MQLWAITNITVLYITQRSHVQANKQQSK